MLLQEQIDLHKMELVHMEREMADANMWGDKVRTHVHSA